MNDESTPGTAAPRTWRFFPGSNTRSGFHSFFDQIAPDENCRTYILKDGPGSGKSTLMRRIAARLTELGLHVELHHCASDNDSLDAMFSPELKVAVMDGTPPHSRDPGHPGLRDFTVNLGDCRRGERMEESGERIEAARRDSSAHFAAAYAHLRAAGAYLDAEMELLMRFDAVDWRAFKETVKRVAAETEGPAPTPSPPHVHTGGRSLFAAAVTPEGMVGHAPQLAEAADRCVVLCDASPLLANFAVRHLTKGAELNGYPHLVLHHGLDPELLDHCFIYESDVAVLSCPASQLSALPADVEVIRAETFLKPGRLAPIRLSLRELVSDKNAAIRAAVRELSAARNAHRRLESIYVPAMDFDCVEEKQRQVLEEILRDSPQ